MATRHPWNHYSVVRCCTVCEGLGFVAASRRPTIDDPYPTKPCECRLGHHGPECAVCGYDFEVTGYDCLACDTVAGLTDSEICIFEPRRFADAMGHAIKARLLHTLNNMVSL